MSNDPEVTSRKDVMRAPSWNRAVDVAGMEPPVMPPMSAWWPREAVKKMIEGFEAASEPDDDEEGDEKTGVMTVRSGRWLPPATGLLARRTSPGLRPSGP